MANQRYNYSAFQMKRKTLSKAESSYWESFRKEHVSKKSCKIQGLGRIAKIAILLDVCPESMGLVYMV